LALWLVWKRGDLNLKVLAQKVGGVDYTTVGSAIQCFQQRCRKDHELAAIRAAAERKLPIADGLLPKENRPVGAAFLFQNLIEIAVIVGPEAQAGFWNE
jgi:hypothetical protein